jgi:hypothetical protein
MGQALQFCENDVAFRPAKRNVQFVLWQSGYQPQSKRVKIICNFVKTVGLCLFSYRRRVLNAPHQMKASFLGWFHICHRPSKTMSNYRKKHFLPFKLISNKKIYTKYRGN